MKDAAQALRPHQEWPQREEGQGADGAVFSGGHPARDRDRFEARQEWLIRSPSMPRSWAGSGRMSVSGGSGRGADRRAAGGASAGAKFFSRPSDPCRRATR
jgi:hypothetical protein